MFTEVKTYNNGQIQQRKTRKQCSGMKRILKPLLRMLGGRGGKKRTTDVPNNLKEATIEDYASVIRKAAKEESFLQSYYEIDPFSEEPFCGGGEADYCGDFQDYAYCEIENRQVVIPVNYIRTDAGTFFWTSAQGRIDDDLIEPLYCATKNQIAQIQWNSGTGCRQCK